MAEGIQITKWKASDGSLWDKQEAAEKHEWLLVECARATEPLGVRPTSTDFTNGGGYVQHTRRALVETKAALIEIFDKTADYLHEWVARQRSEFGVDLMQSHPSWFLRMLDGGYRPLYDAFDRLHCTDEDSREWGQPYYTTHQHEAKQIEWRNGRPTTGNQNEGATSE